MTAKDQPGGREGVIYLDHAATTPLSDGVREAMEPFLGGEFGNPSSRHPLGVASARALDRARRQIGAALGADELNVIFTSGGTEANNLAALGLARGRRAQGRHILVGATEHPSLRDAAATLAREGFEVEVLPLDDRGQLDLDGTAQHLREDTILVLQMQVNNEFGTVYPIARLARLMRARSPRALLHVDAVQALGKLDVHMEELGADSISISAHKVHGPKGAGALLLRPGVEPAALVFGGGQERGLRPGTQNVLGLVGLGQAVEDAARLQEKCHAQLMELRRGLYEGIAKIEGVEPLQPGSEEWTSPAVCALRLCGPPAEVWMHHLEELGIYVSAGSACQATKDEISPALLALGLDTEDARRVLLLSMSRMSTMAAVRRACECLGQVAGQLLRQGAH